MSVGRGDSIYPSEDELQAAAAELIAVVRQQLPMRFYGGEPWWTVYVAASLVRIADTVESIMMLLPTRRDADASTLLRALYEQAITLVWVAADPDTNFPLWLGDAESQMLKLHNDAATFGEVILTPAEVAAARQAPKLPSLAERALAADAHWAARVKGLHARGHLLSLRGLYIAVYRTGSRPAHASINALGPYISEANNRFVVDRATQETILWYALATPLLGIAMMIGAEKFKWLEERSDEILQIVERATTPRA
jgi:uncharacterized protein DUF5677